MKYRRERARALVCWVLSFCIANFSLLANPAMAQGNAELPDSQPPVIELDPAEEGVAGDIQVFNAAVTDNLELLAVLFFYRLAGDEEFNPVDMEQLEGTDYYTVSVTTSVEDIRDIEYFIQAEDKAGNRAIKGFTFDPLIRVMTVPQQFSAVTDPLANATAVEPAGAGSEADSSSSTAASGSSLRSKIIWGVVGLIAVAAIAAALSDDDKKDDSGTTNPITINDAGGSPLSIRW